MKRFIYLPHLTCIVLLLGTLSVLPASAKKIKESITGTYLTDFSTVVSPDSLAALSVFAGKQALINVYHNATGVMIQVVPADALTQREWLFNGLTVYVDPLGKNKKKYSVDFPSVRTLRQTMSLGLSNGNDPNQPQPETQASLQGNHQGQQVNQSTGFRNLIQLFDDNGATLNIAGVSSFAGTSLAKVTETANHRLCYNVILPYSIFNIPDLNPAMISVGILSEFNSTQHSSESTGSMEEGFGGGNRRGGGMRGGGGMGGHRGEGMGGNRGMSPNGGMMGSDEMQKTVEGWIQVTVGNQ